MSKLEAMFAKMTTKGLVDAFVMTDGQTGDEIPTVRGWLMDELEKRNPTAFEAWMDGNDAVTAYF